MVDNMTENYFKDNLLHQLKLKRKKPIDLSRDLGISQATIYAWTNGKSVPRTGSVRQLAEYFHCDIADLTEKPVAKETKTTGVRIPVVGTVIAGIPVDAVENIIGYEEITSEMARSGEYFALRIQGDSMEPRMEEGDIVIVRKQETIENGQVAIVLVNGYEATVKEVHITSDGIELRGYNENFEMIKYSAMDIMSLPVKIIGRVVECRQKY